LEGQLFVLHAGTLPRLTRFERVLDLPQLQLLLLVCGQVIDDVFEPFSSYVIALMPLPAHAQHLASDCATR
jgi:hypothetical protein